MRETRTRRGQTMAFATLEDLEGSFELVIFAEPYATHRELLRTALASGSDMDAPAIPLIVSGTLESDDPPKILLRDVFELSRAEERLAIQVRIRLLAEEATRARLRATHAVFGQHAGDCGVLIHLMIPGESETILALPDARGVEPTDALVRDVNALFGRPVAEVAV
jgi:DNA polymerase-3 subunit alpha